MKSVGQADRPRDTSSGRLLIFAPSDADSEYLELQKELTRFREKGELDHLEILQVFETTEVPKSDTVVDPDEAGRLRAMYEVARGSVTVVALSPADQHPVSRVTTPVSRLELSEALAELASVAEHAPRSVS